MDGTKEMAENIETGGGLPQNDDPSREMDKESRFDEVVMRAVRTAEPFSPQRAPSYSSSDANTIFADEEEIDNQAAVGSALHARKPPTPPESRISNKSSPLRDAAAMEYDLPGAEEDEVLMTPPRVERFDHEDPALSFYDNIHHNNPFTETSDHASTTVSELTFDEKNALRDAIPLSSISPVTQPPRPITDGGEHSFTGSAFGTLDGDTEIIDSDDRELYGDYALPGKESSDTEQFNEEANPNDLMMVDNVPSSFAATGQQNNNIGSAYSMIFSSFGLAPGDTVGSQPNNRKDRSPGRTSQTGTESNNDIERQQQEQKGSRARDESKPRSILATKVIGPFRLDCMITCALLLVVVVMTVAVVAALLKESDDGDDDRDGSSPTSTDEGRREVSIIPTFMP